MLFKTIEQIKCCILRAAQHPELHLCANQPRVKQKPRQPAAETTAIIQIPCEQRLNIFI